MFTQMLSPNIANNLDIQIISIHKNIIMTKISTIDGKDGEGSEGDNSISFSTNDPLQLNWISGDFIHHFSCRFKRKRKIEGNPFYQFIIDDFQILNNLRKDKRININSEGTFLNFNQVQEVKILDVSKGGMKIKTSLPIKNNTIEIFHENFENHIDYNSTISRGRIVWNKNHNDDFTYGIEFFK